jgi:hypothetical protein
MRSFAVSKATVEKIIVDTQDAHNVPYVNFISINVSHCQSLHITLN